MNNCLELIYDRFGLWFYAQSGVQFNSPMMLPGKFLDASSVILSEGGLYLQVGHYDKHTGKQIRSNDTASEVTSSVSEEFDNEVYTVKIHFEFTQPSANAVGLCEALDKAPFHVVVVRYALDGSVADKRIIRNGEGQSRTTLTESAGVVSVDMTVVCANGIQLLG